MGEGRAPRRLVIDGDCTLGVLDLDGDGYVFRAQVDSLRRLDGHRFRSPEVGIALLKTFAGPPAARRAPAFDLGVLGFSQSGARASANPAFAGDTSGEPEHA
jgi:hypothetical protein